MEAIWSRLFLQVWNMSMTAGWCIGAILILHLVFRKMPRTYLYALWLVAAFRLICPVSLHTDVSVFNLVRPSGRAVTEEPMGEAVLPDERNTDADVFGASQTENAENTVPAGYVISKFPLRGFLYKESRQMLLLAAGPYIWAAGMLAFALYFAVSTWRLQRKVRMAVLAEEPGISCPVYECDDLISPFAAGAFRPRIYLPCHLEGTQRRMVLLHEQCHIRRKDHLVKMLAFFLLAVYWFHPLVWAAWFGMCRDMEMSCDEKVLEQLGEARKKEYGMTLLSCAVKGHPGYHMPLAFGEQAVESRIRHVMGFRRPAVWVGIGFLLLFAVVFVLFGTNGTRTETPADPVRSKSKAEILFEAKNPYIGDASANGKLAGAIGSVLEDCAFQRYMFTTELQTSEEPYQYCYILSDVLPEQPSFWEMAAPATLMLALTDNMGEAKWEYRLMQDGRETNVFQKLGLEEAADWCQVDDIKAYAESPEKLQELLDILEELRYADTRLDVDRMMEALPEENEQEETEDGGAAALQQ